MNETQEHNNTIVSLDQVLEKNIELITAFKNETAGLKKKIDRVLWGAIILLMVIALMILRLISVL